MAKKLTIKEVEMPYVLVGDEERKYELLCEFQSKDGAFQRAYVQDAGEDVIIEIGKDSAIVGLFSVEEGKAGALFDYIEATVDGKDGFVTWLSGEFEQLLEQASKQGGWYPLIRNGIGLEDKLPLFYRQKTLDSITARVVAEHTVSVDYVQESLEDLDEEMLFTEPDEVFDVTPKVTQAGLLPDGWKWVDYDDGSGHLESPNGKKYFDYDRQPYYGSGNIEYREAETDLWGPFFDFDEVGSFDDFKQTAEKTILEHVLENVGGLSNMDKIRFYVIEDLKKNTGCLYFGDVAAAHERFMEVLGNQGTQPGLGVEVADGAVDLLHGVGGTAVLVPDIYQKDAAWSEPMKAALGDIQEAARWLVMEGGGVSYEYQNGIVPAWLQGDVKVLVPVTLGEKAPSSYCDDKVLKTTVPTGLDAIDSLYLENHGWVAYDELLRNSKEYAADGVIKVQFLNVNYVQEKNVVGIDGGMDISPAEFKGMVERISRPYQLSAYDGTKYTGSYRDKHEFIVGSFETIAEAVKGWYEVQERRRVPMLVESHVPGEDRVVFNGYDESDKRMSYEEAAGKFGLDLKELDAVLGDAENRAGKIKRECEPDRELE